MMKVILLSWGDYQLGVFSNKEKANEAELFYAQLSMFADQTDLFEQEEYELDKYSDEDYQDDPIADTNPVLQKVKNLLGTGFFYLVIILLIISLFLGVKSLYAIIVGLFKS
jgi:hypothetical protein